MSHFHWDGRDLILHCHLQPKASANAFAGLHGDRIKIRLTAPPVDGKANALLQAFLATAFAVSKQHVCLEASHQSRQKRVRIKDPQSLPTELVLTARSS
jgi:uncharacterized protein (TIGR00251 family)